MKPAGPVLRKSDWFVAECSMNDLHEMVARYHYAGRGSNTATYRFGLYRNADKQCCGVAWWIPPTKGAAAATWPGDWRQVLSLHRLVCSPEAPANSESFLLGQAIRRIRQDCLWRCLVTYADTRLGHLGVIYRATGWEYLGLTTPEPTFVDAFGRDVARKAGGRTRTRREMADLGYHNVGAFARHKYRKVLKTRVAF